MASIAIRTAPLIRHPRPEPWSNAATPARASTRDTPGSLKRAGGPERPGRAPAAPGHARSSRPVRPAGALQRPEGREGRLVGLGGGLRRGLGEGGAWLARIGVEAERQGIGERRPKIDRRAVVEDHVQVLRLQFKLLIRADDGLGPEQHGKGLVDMGRHWLAGRYAGLLDIGPDPALRPHLLALAAQHRMRLEPLEPEQPQQVSDAFRVARFELGEQSWDWDAARVPPALSKAEADKRDERERKEAEAKEAERRKAEELRLRSEGPKVPDVNSAKGRGRSLLDAGAKKTAQEKREDEARGLTPEQRMRLDRERRARAAEERFRRMRAGGGGGGG